MVLFSDYCIRAFSVFDDIAVPFEIFDKSFDLSFVVAVFDMFVLCVKRLCILCSGKIPGPSKTQVPFPQC